MNQDVTPVTGNLWDVWGEFRKRFGETCCVRCHWRGGEILPASQVLRLLETWDGTYRLEDSTIFMLDDERCQIPILGLEAQESA